MPTRFLMLFCLGSKPVGGKVGKPEKSPNQHKNSVETCRRVRYNKTIYGKRGFIMEKIKEQLERLLPQMTRIIISNRMDKTYQYRKVEVTWTTVRGK